jgi:tetratricopeptide (TPR) repeat protein
MKRIAGLIGLTVSLMVAPAHAEGPTAPAAETPQTTSYDQWIEQGEAALIASDWQRCLELFQRAHKISPSAITYLAIGRCALERQDYVTALHHLQEGLHYPLSEIQQSRAQDMYAIARRNLGRYVIELEPQNAQLQVDGAPAAFEQGRVLWLVVGQHRLQARALGYATLDQSLEAKPNDDRPVQLKLEPAPQNVATLGPAAKRGDEARSPLETSESGAEPSKSNTVKWILVSSSAAVAVAGGVFLGLALSDKSKVENAKDGADADEIKSAHDRVPVFSTLGIAMIGVGVAGAAAAVTWMVMDGREEREVTVGIGPGSVKVRGVF